MVITSTSSTGSQHFAVTGSKLRRSRRLSSTRGLHPRNTKNSHSNDQMKPDLNQKLGLCPIVSKNLDNDIMKHDMNWDLNERISLTSGSINDDSNDKIRQQKIKYKTNDQIRKKKDLKLMNVSGFSNESQKNRDLNHRIDSKIVKNNHIFLDDDDDNNLPKNDTSKENEVITTAQRRWIAAKEKVDRTNESISKRLELIHELNQKIFSNCEKFHRKNNTKNGELKINVEKKSFNDNLKNCEIYSKIPIIKKDKENIHDTYERNGLFKQKVDINKFTFSKDYCERLLSTEKLDPKKSQSSDNFSLAIRPEFVKHCREMKKNIIDNESTIIENRSDVSRSVFYVENDDDKSQVKKEVVQSCLESSRLYPVSYQNGSLKKPHIQNDDDDDDDSLMEKMTINQFQNSPSKESKDTINFTSQEKILEDEILKNLNDTIGSFDIDKNDTPSSDSMGKNESFSTDSIQSLSPITSSQSAVNTTLQETFNSSWDSGVSVEVGSGSGWVRVHTGIESSLVYLTLETTCKDVCRDMLLGDELSLFIQYGGEPGRRLSPQEKPLDLQDAFLQSLGYEESSRRARLGVDPELRHLISFHVGPSAPLNDLTGYSHCGYVLILKGLVFPQWKRRVLAVIGSRLFLYPACQNSKPEWIELGDNGGAVCYAPSRLGKLVLRVTGYPRIVQQQLQNTSGHTNQMENKDENDDESDEAPFDETRHLYLGFHHPWDRDLWLSWLKKASQLSSCPKKLDMSKGGLCRIPNSAVAFPAIEELMLGQNQLSNVNSNLNLLQRFPKLRTICLERNNLQKIPWELLQLENLNILNLSDNKIEKIPPEICELVNLKELNLDRNEIKELPEEVGELRHLKIISLAGNSISSLPRFLKMRALAITDVLSKGDHGKMHKEEKNNHNNLQKVNLRNNHLKGSIILGNYGNLTHLDVSENSIEKLDISALQELRSVRCARNSLTELTVCGRNLVSLIAGNNKLKKLTIEPTPTNLEHLDVSYNSLDSLPEWTPELPVLRALFASHNALTALPDRLLSQPSRLEVLHLPHNRLQALPPPRRPLNIVHLTLQGNALTALPTSFFVNTEKMKVLNLSNNRLSELSFSDQGNKNRHVCHALEKLYLTGNCLTDTVLDALTKFSSLRVLHMAYNVLDTLPESCIASWTELEELVLSGNRLQYLPDNVSHLKHLRVLRVHSNRLLICPTFNKTTSLKVLDLAHNQLDRVNLSTLVPPQLQFLDISCNTRLHVDPRQFQVYRSQRPVSLVDVSGQNRPSLPSHPQQQESSTGDKGLEQPWRLGFSETAGTREKLYVSQVRMPTFCNVEGLFGIFDGGSNQEAPSALQEMIPRLLLEERTIRETSNEYLKYTLLSAHRELKEKGQKYGIDATLCHITKLPNTQGFPRVTRKYSLKIASSGDAKAVLCRAAGPLTLAASKKMPVKNQLGNAAMFPLIVPDPTTEEVILEDDDEFVIIANRRVWEVLSVQEAVREARAEASPVLAAKRLQDLAQAYGAEDNLSIVVVRLTGPGQGDLDQLMRELRQAVNKNRNQNECSCPCCIPPTPHKPPAPCCCHVNNEGYYLNGVLKNIVNRSTKSHNGSGRFFKNCSKTTERAENESPPFGDDRSSPSGQSDQTSDSTFKSRRPSGRTWAGNAASRAANKVRQSTTTTTPSAVSLQENRKSPICITTQDDDDIIPDRTGALTDEQFRCWEYMLEQNTQLLFDKELDTLTRSPLRRGQSRSTPQLAVIQERSGLDSLEQDASRMQQYWGVATTEL
ncbi:PH domain leucine-rich repeat-containing protein phosphatase 2 isoform X2 [Leptopilina boulardi]|uniref:PH domain leucine-rich repeat-containing protein phosphatase 2 isoform X2 n=1 Tax=Leptopilina boulardi TaxID=63433 RepID=UPI0021F539EA|nr:PH domain leucine-rich repeat-containing protein phosphatase 2 isoform X2 [Leptopilina boulardi]